MLDYKSFLRRAESYFKEMRPVVAEFLDSAYRFVQGKHIIHGITEIATKLPKRIFGGSDLVLLLFNAIVVLTFVVLVPAYYETNDDVMMQFICSGAYSGTPDAHLVFINYLYGLPLTWLYNLTMGSGIEWYPIMFVVWHILSLYIISKLIVRSRLDNTTKIVYVLSLYAIEWTIIMMFQFTTTAALLALAGLSLAYCRGGWRGAVGILLFLLASLIRFDAAMLLLLLLLPIVAYQFFVEKKMRLKLFLCCAVAISGAFALNIYDKHVYSQDPDWAYFKEWNGVRGKINDNPNAEKSAEKISSIISEADYWLLLNFMADPAVLTLEKIKDIEAILGDTPLSEKLKNSNWFKEMYGCYLDLLLLISLLLICATNVKRKRWCIALYTIFWFALAIYISLNGYVKIRVFITMLLPALVVILYMMQRSNRFGQALSHLCIITLMWTLCDNSIVGRNYKRRCRKETFSESIDLINRNEGKTFVFNQSGNFSFEYINPFIPEFKRSFYGEGWMTNIPFNKGKFDSHKDLLKPDMIVFSRGSGAGYIPSLNRSVKDNYGVDVKTITVDSTENFKLLRLVEVTENKKIEKKYE